jgi:hypothetical protein
MRKTADCPGGDRKARRLFLASLNCSHERVGERKA